MYCPNCGLEIQGGIRFCPNCGTPVAPISAEPQPQSTPEPEPTPQPTVEKPVQEGIVPNSMEKTLALEAYLGILLLAPLFGAKKSPFVRFHVNQGIVLFAISFVLSTLMTFNSLIMAAAGALWLSIILGFFNGLYGLVSCGVIALSVIGIINALKGKMKALPLIGKIKILK